MLKIIKKRVRLNIHSKVLLSILVVVLLGCEKNIKKEYYETGELLAEYEVVNNLRNGNAKEFYLTGELFRISRYENDTLHGKYKEYYKSSELKSSGIFINGKLTCSLRKFYKDGRIKKLLFIMMERNMHWVDLMKEGWCMTPYSL